MTARLPTTERDLNQVQRGYSVLEIKEVSEDQRWITGIATTPEVDRMGDIVEPLGVTFKNPLPLLLYHDSWQPVGAVKFGKPTKNGIPFEAEIASTNEPGRVKERLDEAWHSVKLRLIRGVSIGFRVLNDAVEYVKETGGLRFLETEVVELSLVVIPANSAATITSIKSAYLATQRAASGAKAAPPVVRLTHTSPGASGQTAANVPKGNSMKTIQEQITALEATRQAKAARMAEIMQKSAGEGRTTDEAEAQEVDGLSVEVKRIDEDLVRLREVEKLAVATGTTLTPAAGADQALASQTRGAPVGQRPNSGIISVKSNIEPGIRFARMAMCVARAKYLQKEGRFMAPEDIYRQEKRWMDTAPEVAIAMKAAVNANDSTTAGGASEWAYAQNIESEFIEYLRPRTLLGRIQGWRQVPFNCRVGGMDGGATGYWTGQGLGIPVSRPTSTSVSLGITKVGGICVVTKELAMLSTPSAELMIRNDLARAVQQKSDSSLIDPNSGGTTNVQPASLTYGVSPRTASGTDYAAFKADWKAMTTVFYAANIPLDGAVVIMKEELAEALSLMVTSLGNPQFPGMTPTGGTLLGRPALITQIADTSGSPDYDNLLILLQPGEVFLADDGQANVEASDQVSIEMSDGPGNKSTPTATGASLVSMFQTESVAIKAVRHINWTKARSQACQFIRTAAYV